MTLPFGVTICAILLCTAGCVFFFFTTTECLCLVLLRVIAPVTVVLFLSRGAERCARTCLGGLFIYCVVVPTFLVTGTLNSIVSRGIVRVYKRGGCAVLKLLFTFIFGLFLFTGDIGCYHRLFWVLLVVGGSSVLGRFSALTRTGHGKTIGLGLYLNFTLLIIILILT